MTCNLCGFKLPSPDPISVELMKAHLWEEHQVKRFRPTAPIRSYPNRPDSDWP